MCYTVYEGCVISTDFQLGMLFFSLSLSTCLQLVGKEL